MIRIAAVALTTLAAFTACSESGISNLGPNEGVGGRIAVDPPMLEYGVLTDGEEEVRTFEITNVGSAALHIDHLELDGSNSFVLIDPPADFLLPEGGVQMIDVLFTPMGANDQLGHVLVHSDDPETPEERVDLAGEGAVPELFIDPDAFDFGADFVGCGDDKQIGLENIGTDDLIIDEIRYEDPDAQLSLGASIELPVTLAPGERTTVTVAFDPSFEVAALGKLQVHSNEPRGWVTATQEAEGIFATVLQEDFQVPTDPPVDILFAVDQSCSMDGHSANLGSNFSSLIGAIGQVTNSWRIGVVTTDPSGCFNHGVLDSSTPSLASKFSQAVAMGEGTGTAIEPTERLFVVTQLAMTRTNSGQCNSGFLRPNALLHIVLVSDESEQSGISAGTFVTNMQAYKATPSLVKVSGIICSPSGCANANGYDTGYDQAVSLTGGIRLNVMGSGWANYAEQLAAASLSSINHFELAQTAAPDSIVVEVNGSEWTSGWHFDQGGNEVIFDTNPPEGADIHIEYGVLVPCAN